MLHEENKKSILEEFQSFDERTKRKIIIVATAVIMLVVIYFWVLSFHALVGSVATDEQTAPASTSVGFFQSVENGFTDLVHDITGLFQSPRQYIVQPSQ